MMEQITSKGKGVLIEKIMDHDVNDAVRKEFDGESGNSGKFPLLEWNQSSQVEMVAKEMVVEKVVDGQDVVSDGDVIPNESYAAIVAQEGVFLGDDEDVIPDELYGVIVAQEGVFLVLLR
nr:O-fucosyltransferase family protein [Tanacetum cinerariifolium]